MSQPRLQLCQQLTAPLSGPTFASRAVSPANQDIVYLLFATTAS
jgi:hypothetical protein